MMTCVKQCGNIPSSNITFLTNILFDTKMEENAYSSKLSYFFEELGVIMIIPFSREKLLDFINDMILTNYNTAKIKVYLSVSKYDISYIKDSFGKRIFLHNGGQSGWLVFIDLHKNANWSHACEYWFIINEKHSYRSKNEEWKPSSSIIMEALNL